MQLAREIGRIATGEIPDPLKAAPPKDLAAVRLGRAGGLKRAAKLSDEQRKEIARKAAKSRWTNSKDPE